MILTGMITFIGCVDEPMAEEKEEEIQAVEADEGLGYFDISAAALIEGYRSGRHGNV